MLRPTVKVTLVSSSSLKWDNMRKELQSFAAIASSCRGGRITVEEFAQFLKLPVSPALLELFALFDRVRPLHFPYLQRLERSLQTAEAVKTT